MKDLCRLFHAQAAEESEFDDPALSLVDLGKRLQSAIKRHDI